jgi:UDP-N-acetylglucosamine--N-acetylmuramyl-(pentapeptide) pyrophosphoryl-undecaprenol N-acetylglucosamine transferase
MASVKRRTIAVAGGGTAGHVLAALEFFDHYRREFAAEGCFIGCAGGMECRLVPPRGVRMETIPGLPWARQGWFGKLRAVACLPAAIRAARRILRREKTELVIGTGGYAAFSVCLAAITLRLPVAIHEANAEPGLANRILARFASLVCVGFGKSARHFSRPVLVTGVPGTRIRRPQRLVAPPWRFLVLGGSEGSPLLDRQAPLLFAELRRRGVAFSVRHLAGFGDRRAIEPAYAAAGVAAQVEGFVDDMEPVYADASLALASAGARTLAELSAARLPAFLVPLPGAARDHQTANGELYAAETGAVVLQQPWDCSAVASRIEKLLANPDEFRRLSDAAALWARPNAARDFVHACENLFTGRQAAGFGRRVASKLPARG